MTAHTWPRDSVLAERVNVLSTRVAELVAARRTNDPEPDDPYRGMFVSDHEADELAGERGERMAESRWVGPTAMAPPHGTTRLGALCCAFGLDPLDLDLLLLAAAPDLEPRFEKLYGYLHDDLTRRRCTIGLALELTGHGFGDSEARGRLRFDAPLVRLGLVEIEDSGRPLLGRALRVPDRVVAHLLGDDSMDRDLLTVLLPMVPVDMALSREVARILADGISPVHLVDDGTGAARAVAAGAISIHGLDVIGVDLTALAPHRLYEIAMSAAREARLRWCGLVVVLPDDSDADAMDALHMLASLAWPVVLVGRHPWDPAWSPQPVLSERVDSSRVRPDELWSVCMPELDPELISTSVRQFSLRPDQIVRAAALARQRADAASRTLLPEDLVSGARSQDSSKLERLAQRRKPQVQWADMVLPFSILAQLQELKDRYSNRSVVHREWGLGGSANRRVGVVALFAGGSGVGKSMAAEALAGALDLDLYQVNLATVVDKYIGETEKNLERIFSAAEGVNGVIFFDEADALFGKRSEVSDAKDRYANVEVAYLLQRLEVFGGVAILATNLRTNVDDAFTRRLDALIDFPDPDAVQRRSLWDKSLGTRLARSANVDLKFLADRFELSGGNIRNICVAAAYSAAANGHIVTMEYLVHSTAQEYRKLGRLCTAHEFGGWHQHVNSDQRPNSPPEEQP